MKKIIASVVFLALSIIFHNKTLPGVLHNFSLFFIGASLFFVSKSITNFIFRDKGDLEKIKKENEDEDEYRGDIGNWG